MANIKLFFTPALLLLALTCPLWHVCQSVPVPLARNDPITDTCVSQARVLLSNITEALAQSKLFKGINCTEQSMELHTVTRTASVCAPQESTCNGVTESEFDQESCLLNIAEDLHYYTNTLAAYPDHEQLLSSNMLLSLREVMETCFPWSSSKDSPEKQATQDRQSTYDERLHLCKALKGFQIRTITINRILGYIYAAGQSIKHLQREL